MLSFIFSIYMKTSNNSFVGVFGIGILGLKQNGCKLSAEFLK